MYFVKIHNSRMCALNFPDIIMISFIYGQWPLEFEAFDLPTNNIHRKISAYSLAENTSIKSD